jgi:hypothetical protein
MQNNLEHLIRARAHQLWEQEGRPDGRAEHHWREARKLVEVEGLKQPIAKAAPLSKPKARKKAN